MQDILDRLKPIFTRLRNCQDTDQAALILTELVENGIISHNECYAIAVLHTEEKRQKEAQKAHQEQDLFNLSNPTSPPTTQPRAIGAFLFPRIPKIARIALESNPK